MTDQVNDIQFRKMITKISKNIRKRRLELKMHQSQLASAAHTSQHYISDLENRSASPTLKMLLSIANALQIPIKDLIDV
jgi:transcriptional regulator with XRE-family HTH domain